VAIAQLTNLYNLLLPLLLRELAGGVNFEPAGRHAAAERGPTTGIPRAWGYRALAGYRQCLGCCPAAVYVPTSTD
jgi:hypothetical protein